MIKKLKLYKLAPSGFKYDEYTVQEKINELVDAVNKMQAQVAILEEHAQPTAKTEPTDPYAEQRKWIGKLCKFWDKNHEKDRIYDILHHIDPNCVFKYCRRELGGGYQYCEPVKPDDYIIYKGGKDE